MSWLRASFRIGPASAEAVADALLERGALAVELADADEGTPAEQPMFGEPGAEPLPLWRHQLISVLFPRDADVRAAIRAALAALGLENQPSVALQPVAERDWVRASQQQFAPIEVGPQLWIVPSWHAPPDPSAVNLILDPGLAFGTGSHPTTWQCLRWLHANLTPGASVLDYGCGSGVLAIAAKRLGAGPVVAVDIDPVALEATRANAAANAAEVAVASPDAVTPGPYDVVLANILAGPLKLLAPLLASHAAAGGRIVLAGILTAQAADVAAAYAPWCDLVQVSQKDGWACLAGARKG
ncbi:MAG TPA: 50S ribosomal protein L11 methyltransferase [Burkholderiales bacterium]